MPALHSRLIQFICFGMIFFCYGVKSAAQPFPDDFSKAPSLAWEFQTGGPIYSSPVIDKETVYFGSLDSNLYALNSTTGQLKWKFKTGSTVLLDDNSLYCASGDGCLYAIGKKINNYAGNLKGAATENTNCSVLQITFNLPPRLRKTPFFLARVTGTSMPLTKRREN